MSRSVRPLCTLVVLAALLSGGVAYAHKLNVFATGDGNVISGYVYFPGGGRAQEVAVLALAADGSRIGEATTDARGEFTIPARFHCDHTLVAQTADGHKTTYVVAAAELASDLPPFSTAPPGGAEAQCASVSASAAMPAAKGPAASDVVRGEAASLADQERWLSLVEEAVRAQVRPLREQLERYEERTRFRDVLGGIGYIMGVAGIAFYFLGVRRREASAKKGQRS